MEGEAHATLVKVIVQNVIISNKEISLIRGLEKNTDRLRLNLDAVLKFLNYAEKHTIPTDIEPVIKIWLRKLEAVVFEADNVFDELNYHRLSEEINIPKPSTKAKLLTGFSLIDNCRSQRRWALGIMEVNEKLKSINDEATALGLGAEIVDAPIVLPHAASSRHTASFPADPIFVGRDDDVHKLAELLTNTAAEEGSFSILAIQGMGGIGKTRLTRKLFKNQKIGTLFGKHILVHVSQSFDPLLLLKEILKELTCEQVDSRPDIEKRLQEVLKGKTYLLVLDDVWNEDLLKWKDFINSISRVTSTMGNAIVITTRNEQVATTVKAFHIHHLNVLSDEECWSIIKAKAFENGDDPSTYESIGRNIARKCHGLPLAAKIVGELLKKAPDQHKWTSIQDNWLSEDEGQGISEILKLSFDNLPSPSLKRCFAYCSIFPKGHRIVKQELSELWMAEGFLQPDERNDMESVGNKFLNVLLHNSLLLVAERDVYGDIESCVMHDMVHDMASSILGCSNSADGITPVRYMMLKGESSPISKQAGKHLRTLFWQGEIYDDMFSNLECLHSLTLTSVKELPSSIGKLIHLRNLNISKSHIGELPEWIGELHHLQTIRAVTEHLWKLPSKLKYLINLRHLYVLSRVKLPADIGRLTRLQTLRHFAVSDKKGYRIEELGSLNNLKGKLEIRNLEKVHDKEEALKAKLFEKQNLPELLFEWDEGGEGERTDESVLEGLQPHPSLEKLRIRGFKGKRVSLWSEQMAVPDGPQGSQVLINKLIELTLWRCSECEEIPELKHFPNLSKLDVSDCPKLREFAGGLDNLSSLEELLIKNCPNLNSIENPSGGQGQSRGLRSLRIVDCGGLMELPHQMIDSWAMSLEILSLKGLSSLKNLEMVIDSLAKSTCLVELEIRSVPNFNATCGVETWPFGYLQKLLIDVSHESSMERTAAIGKIVNDILRSCSNSLTQLCLIGNEMQNQVPRSIQHLNALSKLELHNLGIKKLPQWLGDLSSLRRLSLYSCKKLRYLPSGDALERLTKLQTLDIKACPRLRNITSKRSNTHHLTIKVDDRWIEPSSNEIVDGRMSTAAIEVLLQNLYHACEEAHPLIRGPIKESRKLKHSLGIIQGYLNDAENKSTEEEGVKIWLRDLEAVAFNADNVLDELSYHLLHKKLVKKMRTPEAENKVLSGFLSWNQIAHRRHMAITIKQISTRFKSLNERATNLGLQSIELNEPASSPDGTSSFILDPIFFGRVEDLQKLVDELTRIPEEEKFSILAIPGVGGVGKTTLSRKLLNHEDIKARFESHIWVHVSRTFNPIMIFKNILSTLTSQAIDGVETGESILRKLVQQALKGKTYLLVLDDVWNEDLLKWEAFVNSISGVTSTKGNAIIITTRSQNVASLVRPLHIHPLNGLPDEECWSIIKAKTFGNRDLPSAEYERVGRKMAKICWGLPLIANVVGGVLGEQDWPSIEKEQFKDVKGYHMFDFLRLSFDNLSLPSMKKCFAYCSIFPRGHIIVKQKLVELWMAEGFLRADEMNDMESVGNNFFNVLLHKSLLLVAHRDAYGNVESCVMHDLVHDLASAVSGDTNQVRYLINNSGPITKGTAKDLRTLIYQGEITDTMFSSFKSLHALTLDCDRVTELPSSIRKLIHLRKLNISRMRIEKLPDWICELRHLQTLNAYAESLRELPSTLKYLISLRHLYIPPNVELPAEIGRLTNLQELRFRVDDQNGYRIEELGSLNNLKLVSIQNLEKVRDKEEAKEGKLFEKQNLKVLQLEWVEHKEGETNDDGVLEGLQPHPDLENLIIAGFKGKKFPSWIAELNNLMNLTLGDCQVCEDIPRLGHLPNLKYLSLLRLRKVRSITSSFYGIDEHRGDIFPALESLSVTDMAELRDWGKVEFPKQVHVFPHLQSLKIYLCNELESLPSWLFNKACNLKELDIRHCSKLKELPDGLHALDSMGQITIKGCQSLESIGGEAQGSLGCLRSLEIRDCQELKVMVESWAMPSLKTASMVELKNLENLPRFLDCLVKSDVLQQLTIVGVPNFVGVEIWPFCRLQKLEVDVSREWSGETSEEIKKTVDGILQKCSSSLGELKLTGIEIWDSVPESIGNLTALHSLELENFGVEVLLEWFGKLPSLRRLCLSNFTKLKCLPSMKRPTKLLELHIRNCPELRIEYEGHKISRLCAIYFNGHPL